MDRHSRVKSRVASAILLFAVVAVVVLAFGLATGRMRAVPILSGSMRPMVDPGDLAVVTPVSVESVRKGDVIVFQAPTPEKQLVMHRVMSVGTEAGRPLITTKGDANPTKDPWKARLQDDTVWQYSGRVPYVGHAALWARRPIVRFGSMVAVVLIMLWVVLRVIWKAPPQRVELNATG